MDFQTKPVDRENLLSAVSRALAPARKVRADRNPARNPTRMIVTSPTPSESRAILAICRRIAESHDGRILAGNAATSGADFTLSLPSISKPLET